jgi:anti-sigma factor RsiW
MSKDSNIIKEIDDYLSGELSPEHLAEFEKRIREEEELQHDLAFTKSVIEGIEAYAFKNMLKKIHQKLYGSGEESGQK